MAMGATMPLALASYFTPKSQGPRGPGRVGPLGREVG